MKKYQNLKNDANFLNSSFLFAEKSHKSPKILKDYLKSPKITKTRKKFPELQKSLKPQKTHKIPKPAKLPKILSHAQRQQKLATSQPPETTKIQRRSKQGTAGAQA
jgi:hypothetical protein